MTIISGQTSQSRKVVPGSGWAWAGAAPMAAIDAAVTSRRLSVLAEFETSRIPAAIAHKLQSIEEIPADQGDETQMVKFETQALLNSKALEARHDDIAVEQRHVVHTGSSVATERLPPQLPYACSARCLHVEARPERASIDQAPPTLDAKRDASLRKLTSLLGREADFHLHGRVAVAVWELNH